MKRNGRQEQLGKTAKILGEGQHRMLELYCVGFCFMTPYNLVYIKHRYGDTWQEAVGNPSVIHWEQMTATL
jgi:hypothetical protein